MQVGSHYPSSKPIARCVFDRAAAVGMRLDIPAGTAVRFEPGESKTVQLVEIAESRGARRQRAHRRPTTDANAVLARVQQRGFGHRGGTP